jgi:hypothetical protein
MSNNIVGAAQNLDHATPGMTADRARTLVGTIAGAPVSRGFANSAMMMQWLATQPPGSFEINQIIGQ